MASEPSALIIHALSSRSKRIDCHLWDTHCVTGVLIAMLPKGRYHREHTILSEVVCSGYSKIKVKMALDGRHDKFSKRRIPSILELCQQIVSTQRKRLQPTISQNTHTDTSLSCETLPTQKMKGRTYMKAAVNLQIATNRSVIVINNNPSIATNSF